MAASPVIKTCANRIEQEDGETAIVTKFGGKMIKTPIPDGKSILEINMVFKGEEIIGVELICE